MESVMYVGVIVRLSGTDGCTPQLEDIEVSLPGVNEAHIEGNSLHIKGTNSIYRGEKKPYKFKSFKKSYKIYDGYKIKGFPCRLVIAGFNITQS